MSGVLSHTNEGWRVVERYVNRYNPPDFRLVLRKGDEVLDIPVSEESWRAFDTHKTTKPKIEEDPTSRRWRIFSNKWIRLYRKPPYIR